MKLIAVRFLDKVGVVDLERGELRQLADCLHLGVGLDVLADEHDEDQDGRCFEIVNVAVDQQLVVVLCSWACGIHKIGRKSIENKNNSIAVRSSGANHDQHVHVGALVLDALPGTGIELLSEVELYYRCEDEAQ